MITLFFGMLTSVITIFGMLVPTYHYTKTHWDGAESKGHNPYISGFYGFMLGTLISNAIIGSFLIIASGFFPVRYLNCYFTTGGNVQLCQTNYSNDYKEAQCEGLSGSTGGSSSQDCSNYSPKIPFF